MRWLGIIYALASVVCYFGVTQVMSNSITSSITSVYTWGAENKFLNFTEYFINSCSNYGCLCNIF